MSSITEFGAYPSLIQVGPQRERGDRLRGVELGQARSGAPEPRKELEAALLGIDAREGDALLADRLDLGERGGQRGPARDGAGADARCFRIVGL